MGTRITRAAPHVSEKAVRERMQREQRPWCRRRWEILSHALTAPRKAEDIAKTVGVSLATVHQVMSTDQRRGVEAIETPGKGGRRRQSLTVEQDQAFLQPFVARAAKGEIATVAEIHQALSQRGGHPVDDSTTSRLLNRQGWSKPGTRVKATASPAPTPDTRLPSSMRFFVSTEVRRARLIFHDRSQLRMRAWGCTRRRFPCGNGGSHRPRNAQPPRNAHHAATRVISASRNGRSWNR
jgi:transposase